MYKGADGNINWNDISCYHKLAGGICKLTCNGGNFGKMCGINGWQVANDKEYKQLPISYPGNYWQARKISIK